MRWFPLLADLHPQIKRVLDTMGAAPRPSSIEEARSGYDRTSLQWVGEAEEVADISEVEVDPICVRVYRPEDARGAILWIHGGGWVMGNLTSYDPLCRALANRTHATVASVDYRLAPESQFPGPVEDCELALRWAAREFEGEPLAIGGDSAGGNLATVLARRARDAGEPPLCCQLLAYPPTDAACATSSMQRFGDDASYGLGRDEMTTCWAAYAPGSSARSPDASPLRAADLSGLPPAYVLLAECDPLTDEATDYADRLREAGVPVEVRVWPGMIHGFLRWRAAVDTAHEALDEAAAHLRRALDASVASAAH
jgi:acetyl esterase